jgi:uncharacterized membrane protein
MKQPQNAGLKGKLTLTYSTVTECFRKENKIFIIFELFMKGFIKLNIFLFSIWFGYLLNDASGSPLRQLMIYGYESVM